jgi:uncharacterized membrane protein YfcA
LGYDCHRVCARRLVAISSVGSGALGVTALPMVRIVLLGSIPGIIIGSFMANRVSEAILRTLLSVILAVVATRLVFA